MATKSDFLKQPNVQMIWEIIAEHPAIKNQPPKVSSEIYNVMIQNIQGFYEKEHAGLNSLVELNKKFISILIHHVSQHYAVPQKASSSVKVEDIQYDRLSKFEQELKQKQTDFSSAMSLPTPPTPRFKDETVELPLTEMAAALKKATEQRNYDMEVINKSRAVPMIKINENVDRQVPSKDIIDLSAQKHISWAQEENIIIEDDSIDINGLFQKLKRTDPPSVVITLPQNTDDRIQSLETKVDLIIEMLRDLAKK